MPGDPAAAFLYDNVAQAAWMFLLRFGYGIEPNGLGLIKLPAKNSER